MECPCRGAVLHTHTVHDLWHNWSSQREAVPAASVQVLAKSSRSDFGKGIALALAGRFRNRGKNVLPGAQQAKTGKVVLPIR